MCPLLKEAITLEDTEKLADMSIASKILVPLVNRNRCIGGGLCECKCQVNGDAAIRVYLPGEIPLS